MGLAAVSPVSVQAQTTDAADRATGFNIPSQPMRAALRKLMQQGNIQIGFEPGDVDGRTAPAVSGAMSAGEALSRLLAGSGLTFRYATAGSVVIERAPNAVEGAVNLGAIRVEANTDDPASLASLSASSDPAATELTRSYTARSAATSTKLALSPRETPQSVTVVTRQQIEDRNLITMDDALENVAGVTGNTAANFASVNFESRGFTLGYQVDGVPSLGGNTGGYTPNLAIFDRVEVQRGASGLVSGQGNPGGVVNLVRKRPLKEARLSFALTGGSWNYVRGEADVSLPVTDWLRLRAVAAREGSETFRDGESVKRPMIYGIVEADLTPDTLVTVGGSYEENVLKGFFPYGLPRYSDNRDLNLPRSSRGIAPYWTGGEFQATNAFASIEHHFSEDWTFKAIGEYQRWKQIFVTIDTRGAVDPITLTGPKYNYLAGRYGEAPVTKAVDASLSGKLSLFGRSHEVVIGGFYSDYVYKNATSQEVAVPQVTGTIFNFDPASIPAPQFPEAEVSTSETRTRQSGFYGVARLNLADPLKLIVGARLSTVRNSSFDRATAEYSQDKESNVVTPYGGIILDVSRNWSVYVSYADIFQPQSTLFTAAGNRLPPIRGANYEGGVKGQFYGGALNVSLAAFRVMQTNRAQLDPSNPAPCLGSPTRGDCYVAEGKTRAQGFETEVSGQIVPDWEVVASYTYTKTKYLRDSTSTGAPSANQGMPFSTTTPMHIARFWSTYRLNDWQIGGGVNYQSDFYRVDGIYNVTQKGYALVSARLGYHFNAVTSIAVNVENLTDKTYYQRLGTRRNGSRYGEPRNVMVTLRSAF